MMRRQTRRKKASLGGGLCPPTPRIYRFQARMTHRTMKPLERRIGPRRDATRAPTPAPEWRALLSQGVGGRGRLCRPKITTTSTHNRNFQLCNESQKLKTGHFICYKKRTFLLANNSKKSGLQKTRIQISNEIKSVPPKHVEQPTAKADPIEITLSESSHLLCVPSVVMRGKRQSSGAPELAPTQIPRIRMPAPAAMANGRFQCSIPHPG